MTASAPRVPGGPTGSRKPRTPGKERSFRISYGHWWWTLPAVLFMLGVIYLSTATGAFFAFTNWTGIGAFDFVGFDNFVRMAQNTELVGALVNTLVLAAAFLVLTNVLGLAFAVALNRTLKLRYLLRTLIFMPAVLSPIAVSYIWKFIFAYEGPLNQLLGALGLESMERVWLADPNLALWCILTVMVWQNIGIAMVLYLAGLASVAPELEEAAAIDGAGPWRRFRNITVPMIQPSIAISSTLSLIYGLRVFDQVLALTDGGPGGATETLATEVYKTTFVYNQFGFGAAMALVLTLIILVFSVGQQAATRDRSGIGD